MKKDAILQALITRMGQQNANEIMQIIEEGISLLGDSSSDNVEKFLQSRYNFIVDSHYNYYNIKLNFAEFNQKLRYRAECIKNESLASKRSSELYNKYCEIVDKFIDCYKSYFPAAIPGTFSVQLLDLLLKYNQYIENKKTIEERIKELEDKKTILTIIKNEKDKKEVKSQRIIIEEVPCSYVESNVRYTIESRKVVDLFLNEYIKFFNEKFIKNSFDLQKIKVDITKLKDLKRNIVSRFFYELFKIFCENDLVKFEAKTNRYGIAIKKESGYASLSRLNASLMAIFVSSSGIADFELVPLGEVDDITYGKVKSRIENVKGKIEPIDELLKELDEYYGVFF